MQATDEIKALVATTIQTKIVQAFHDAPEAIDKLVEAALSQEVDQHGGKPGGFHSQKMPYLTWLVGDTIRRVARDAITEAVKAREDDIRGAVKKAVSAKDLVDGLTNKILGTLDQDYKINIKFADDSE